MTGMWEGFTGLEKVYFTSAVAGGTFFVFWLVMQIVGAGDHGDVDTDVAHGHASHGDAHGDVDPSFKVLSFQGLSSFFTMFGVVGLALSKNGSSPGVSSIFGTGSGFVMLLAMAWLFMSFKKMQSSGTLVMKNAIGKEGTVYLTIPGDGTGKVRVAVQDRLQVFDAVSDQKQDIPTGARIKVVGVISGETLSVVKL